MISAQRIEWGGLDSLEFDLITCLSFDSDNGNSTSFLNQDGVYTEHYDGHRTVHRAKTNEYFAPTFTFIKDGFGDFTMEEQRKVLSWLSTEKPGWLNVYHDDSNVLSYRCFGIWESIELYKLGNGRVVGYVATFTSTHPYAFSPKMEITKQISEPTSFTIVSNSDEYNKLIYPKVTIKFDNDIYIPIKNMTEAQLLDTTFAMIPNTIYALYNNNVVPTYYVNIPTVPYRGVVNIGTFTIEAARVGAYYCMDGINIVRKTVAANKTDYVWETVSKVGAAVKIENITTKTNTIVSGIAKGETIVLDGMNKIVSAYNALGTQEVKIIGNSFNFEWLPLKYGDNNLSIIGNCKITFEWIEPRKVGDM